MTTFHKLAREAWPWTFLAAFAVWLATIIYTGGQGSGAILTAALSFATFSVIVGLGQMLVVTSGPGNVDLSIPATITLAGVVAMKVMDPDNARLLIGIAAELVSPLFKNFISRQRRIAAKSSVSEDASNWCIQDFFEFCNNSRLFLCYCCSVFFFVLLVFCFILLRKTSFDTVFKFFGNSHFSIPFLLEDLFFLMYI